MQRMQSLHTRPAVSIREMLECRWPLAMIEKEVRFRVILAALRAEKGSCKRAAAALGIHRNTLSRTLTEHGVRIDRKRLVAL